MPRDLRAHENQRRSKALRERALARSELRGPSEPRSPAAGPTSHAVKATDPGTRAAIDRFLEAKKVAHAEKND